MSGCTNTEVIESSYQADEAQQEGTLGSVSRGTLIMMRPTTIADKRWERIGYGERNRREGMEYFIRLENGLMFSVSHDKDSGWFVGQKVFVIDNGERTRIVAENQTGSVTTFSQG